MLEKLPAILCAGIGTRLAVTPFPLPFSPPHIFAITFQPRSSLPHVSLLRQDYLALLDPKRAI